ncbi:MAG TPA: hypothetical protein VGO66_08710 [Solirubrobacterales bacterium]|jgi:hypothetical protein|nr:hypothetical protein [Solirubrobacterales bacterium]
MVEALRRYAAPRHCCLPHPGGLYRYLAERDADPEGKVVVELEGTLSEERDLDADAGALLVHPQRILTIATESRAPGPFVVLARGFGS